MQNNKTIDTGKPARASLIVLIGTLCISPVTVADMYRWTDASGKVIYSDKPNPNGKEEKIKGSPLSTYEPSSAIKKQLLNPTPKKEIKQPHVSYTDFTITAPANDTSVRANDGNVSIKMKLMPALNARRGDKIEIYLDGKKVGETTSLSYNFSNMDRGTHTVKLTVVNGAGKSLKSSSVTFHLKRASAG